MDWRDLLHVEIKGWGLDVHAGITIIVAVGAIALLLVAASRRGRAWRVTKANFSFAGCGQVDICPDNEVARIAHEAWVQLRTRKAAIPFDLEHDVIAEVYNSWYELFRALRDLAKSVPAECVRQNRDAPVLVDVLMKALNVGLRPLPHLTTWQARFRRWYEFEMRKPETQDLTPQETQRRYPEYQVLVADLVRVNAGMIEFAEELRRIAHERRRGFSLRNLLRRSDKKET